MSERPRETGHERLRSLLHDEHDGVLDDAGRAELADVLESSDHVDANAGELRASLRGLDDALRGEFADVHRPIDLSSVLAASAERGESERGVPSPATFRLHRLQALAAVLAVVASLFAVQFWQSSRPDPINASQVYAAWETQFQPQVVCDSPTSVERYTRDVLDLALAVAEPNGIELVGWRTLEAYRPDDPEQPRVMMARDGEGRPVLVFFQHHARRPVLDAASGLRLHRANLGQYVAYEVSASERPVVLPLMRVSE